MFFSKFNNEVGDINNLRAVTGNNTSTIADELADVYARLIWNEITSGE